MGFAYTRFIWIRDAWMDFRTSQSTSSVKVTKKRDLIMRHQLHSSNLALPKIQKQKYYDLAWNGEKKKQQLQHTFLVSNFNFAHVYGTHLQKFLSQR